MTTRKNLRRKLFTAAVSTALMLSAVNSSAITYESTVRGPSSGIQRVQYQTGQAGQPNGQPGGQPDSSVSAELQKIFEANGQPMPSMNERDLPNAHVHQPAMAPQTQAAPQQQPQGMQQPGLRPQGMQQQGMAKAQQPGRSQTPQPPKKNFLQKFIGKVNGAEKKASEAAVIPPVPPGYQEPAPAPPSGGTVTAKKPNGQYGMQGQPAMQQPQNRQPNGQYAGSQPAQNSNAQNNPVRPASNGKVVSNSASVQNGSVPQGAPRQSNAQPRTATNASQPGANSGNSSQTRMTQASSSKVATGAQGQSRAVKQPSQPVPAAPVFNAPAVPGAAQNRVANSASGYPTPRTQQYVQPGTAPAFMPGAQSPRTASTQTAAAAPVAVAPSPRTVTTTKPADDGFEDPFNESSVGDETSDVLDLNSIANTPAIEATVPSQPEATAAPIAATRAEAPPSKAVAGVVPFTANTPTAETLPTFTEDGAVPLEPVDEELNPFTGVRLDETNVEMFDPSLSGTSTDQPAKSGVRPFAPSETGGDFGDPAPPMEEFSDDLPAIGLPPVDEFAIQAVEPAPSVMTIPDLDGKESLSPSSSAATSTPISSSTTNSAGAPSRQSGSSAVDVTESSTAPLRSVDTERLQQATELERRTRQQRMIQSRSSQTGFKGFCPVELRDRRELIDTKPECTATFGLQTYSFSSAAAKAAFEADPSRYAPAAGGSDVVLLVNSGEEQPGMLDYALWYRDRLYLFRSRETMALFNSDPLRFSNQY